MAQHIEKWVRALGALCETKRVTGWRDGPRPRRDPSTGLQHYELLNVEFDLRNASLGTDTWDETRSFWLVDADEASDAVSYGAWGLGYEHNVIKDSISMGCVFLLTIHVGRLARGKLRRLRGAVTAFIAEAAMCGPIWYGLVDVADLAEIAAGGFYSAVTVGYVTFDRQLREKVWLRKLAAGERLAQGVFWGNVLGPDMLERLADAGLLDRLKQRFMNRRESEWTDLHGGASLFYLSNNIENFIYQFDGLRRDGTLEYAAELREILLAAQLLA
jgi:hypothetical protein